MEQRRNLFVDYLNRYTTASPDHEAAFDEYIAAADPPPAGPLRLTTKIEQFLTNRFRQPRPPSVILTGNAGDGKTYLCRQVFHVLKPQVSWNEWIDKSVISVTYESFQFFIVKDLSEISEDKGREILLRLNNTLHDSSLPERYLIAANEGRLRALLASIAEEEPIKQLIQTQLDHEPSLDQQLIVCNLNWVATSTFLQTTLTWMTNPQHWQDCRECSLAQRCPIRFNAERLRSEQVQDRVYLLYQLLEHSNEHVTIRDMLIHLAYTITGGWTCNRVQENVREDMSHIAYYENIFGREDDLGFQQKSHTVRLLNRLHIGRQSIFALDEFIISGGETDEEQTQHQHVFGETVDLHFKAFHQVRGAYLKGLESERARTVLQWLPHCRRKLFFEGEQKHALALLPFRFFQQYEDMLQSQKVREFIRRQVIKGLNRAFSRLYLTKNQRINVEERLYITTQYMHSVNQTYPLVLLTLPMENIKLQVKLANTEYLDVPSNRLYLTIAPPPLTKLSDPVEWPVSLLLFEYLMRLAEGGHSFILAEECALEIRSLKDRLIQQFASSEQSDQEIEFFVPVRHRYDVRRLRLDDKGKVIID